MSGKKAEELQQAFGFLYASEVAGLKALAAMLPPTPIAVNVGAGVGTSALALLEERPDLQLYSVDIQGGIAPEGGLGNERFALNQAGIDYQGRYTQIVSDSIKAAESWQHGKVDFIFIDGEHSYTYLRREAEAWLAHVKRGGIMAFHDYGGEFWGDLKQAVDEFAKAHRIGKPILHVDTLAAFEVKR